MRRKVLLTGATGFVGRQVLKSLLKQGALIKVVVRPGSAAFVDSFDLISDVVTSPDMFRETAEWWAETCDGIDTIVHVAWYAEPGKYLQSGKNIDCLAGTLQLANGALEAGVKRFVGVGTCFEYALGDKPLSTATPLVPLTPYAGAKAATFLALAKYLPAQKCSFAWCRLFYLHGQNEDPRRLVPYLHQQLSAGNPAELTSGSQVRDFLEVSEAGRRIARIALDKAEGAINICSGIPVTVRQLAEKIADEYGRRDLLHFGARPDNLTDPPYVVGIPGNEELWTNPQI